MRWVPNLDPVTKSRIARFQKQMKSFTFYFGLHLNNKLCDIADKLPKTLQEEKM